MYVMRSQAPRSGLKDLDAVVLTAAVQSDDGETIEAGSHGTVVGVWRDGVAFEVEFSSPVAGLATVLASDLVAESAPH